MPKTAFMLKSPVTYATPDAFDQDLATLAALGYDGVEIHLGDPHVLDWDWMARVLEENQLALCSLAPGASYFQEGLCLTSPDDAVRTAAVVRLRDYINVACRFGAAVVVGQMQGFKTDEPDRGRANARLVDCMRQVCGLAEVRDVNLLLEPINRFEVGHNHTLVQMMEVEAEIESPAVGVMLDTFHINIEENSLDRPVRTLGKRLGLLHVLENHRGEFGSGHLDLPCILRATVEMGYQGFWVCGDFCLHNLERRATAAMAYLRRYGLVSSGD